MVNSSFFTPPVVDVVSMAERKAAEQKQKEEFAELQGYIDELTEEKYALERALQNHARLMETLHDENLALTKQVGSRGERERERRRATRSLRIGRVWPLKRRTSPG